MTLFQTERAALIPVFGGLGFGAFLVAMRAVRDGNLKMVPGSLPVGSSWQLNREILGNTKGVKARFRPTRRAKGS